MCNARSVVCRVLVAMYVVLVTLVLVAGGVRWWR